VHFIAGTAAQLKLPLMTSLGQYRHKVFVETLGWQLQAQNGQELDQFDRDDTVYVVALDETRKIIGAARLLCSTKPYLLGEVFPQLMHGLALPCCTEVWELSRFAAVDFSAAAVSPLAQFSSPVAVALLKESLRHAVSLGAKQLITVSPLGVERLLRKAGFRSHRAGPPQLINGSPVFACWIDAQQVAELAVS
jgi:acyl homoserine lactone synthase